MTEKWKGNIADHPDVGRRLRELEDARTNRYRAAVGNEVIIQVNADGKLTNCIGCHVGRHDTPQGSLGRGSWGMACWPCWDSAPVEQRDEWSARLKLYRDEQAKTPQLNNP